MMEVVENVFTLTVHVQTQTAEFYFPVPVLHNFKCVFCETRFCPLRPS